MIEGEGSLTADGNVKVGDDVYEAGAGRPRHRLGRAADPRGRVRRPRRSTPGAPGRCPSSRRRSPSSAPAPRARRSPPPTRRFGTEVLLIEMLDQILPAEDKDMARVVERAFKKQGIEISTGAPVENVEAGKSSVKFTYGDKSAEVDYLCIAGGRAPDVEGAGPRGGRGRARGERQDQGRRVPADLEPEGLRDRRPGQRQGARPQGLRGGRRRGRARGRRRDPPGRPGPGRRRHLLPPAGRQRRPHRGGGQGGRPRRQGRQAETRRRRRGRPSTTTKTGIVKLVVDAKYGEILGAHIVGNRACDMIAELVATMALEGGYQELAADRPPAPDDLRGGPRRRPRRRRLGDPRLRRRDA